MGAGGSAAARSPTPPLEASEEAGGGAIIIPTPPSPNIIVAPSSGSVLHLAEDPPSSDDDGEEVDASLLANLSAWFSKAGLVTKVADAAACEAVRRGLHNPRRLLDEWAVDKELFDSFDCLSRHDVKDILLTPLFRAAVMQHGSTAASSRSDPFERIGYQCDYPDIDEELGHGPGNDLSYLMADSAYLQELMQQQVALDTAARELRARQQLHDDRARRIIEETQSEMMEMLDYAMQLSLQHTAGGAGSYGYDDINAGIFGPPMASLIGNPPPEGRNSSSSADRARKVVISRFDPQMSSPLLEYSPSFNSAYRRGSVGTQPAALVFAPGPRCCLSLRLEAAPPTASFLSIGLAVWSASSGMVTGLLNGTYRCFGKTPLSWGVYDRRDADGAEVWADGRRVGACRSLSEGDVVSLSTDLSQGLADLYLNNSIIYTFDALDRTESFVLGSTVCDDHKLLVVCRDLPTPRPPHDDADALQGGVLAGILAGMADERYSDEESESPEDVIRAMAAVTGRSIGSPTPAAAALPLLSQRARAVPLPAPAPAPAASPVEGKLLEGAECVICLSAPKVVVLMPCRHMCLCESCGLPAGRKGVDQCPICRRAVADRFKVFV